MKAKYGIKSLINLTKRVDPRLVLFFMMLEQQTDLPCDWTIFETERSLEQQKLNVKKGVSKTLNSNHIPNSKGIVNAGDIVAYVDGKNTCEEKYYHLMIPIMRRVRKELNLEDVLQFGYNVEEYASHRNKERIETLKILLICLGLTD